MVPSSRDVGLHEVLSIRDVFRRELDRPLPVVFGGFFKESCVDAVGSLGVGLHREFGEVVGSVVDAADWGVALEVLGDFLDLS